MMPSPPPTSSVNGHGMGMMSPVQPANNVYGNVYSNEEEEEDNFRQLEEEMEKKRRERKRSSFKMAINGFLSIAQLFMFFFSGKRKKKGRSYESKGSETESERGGERIMTNLGECRVGIILGSR